MYANQGKVYAFDTNPNISVLKLNAEGDQNFEKYEYRLPEKKLQLEVEKVEPLGDAVFLKTSAVDELDSKNILRHRFFLKEFSLNNPSEVKRAQLIIHADTDCKVQLNNRWVNQTVMPGKLTVLDVTGYTKKGENILMLDFPFEAGDKVFAANLEVEYFNSNRIEIATDQSWLMKDSYIYPTYLTGFGGFIAPEIMDGKAIPEGSDQLEHTNYVFSLPKNYLDGLNNVYLQIDYTGDKGKLYFNPAVGGR